MTAPTVGDVAWLTSEESAHRARCSEWTVRKAARDGHLTGSFHAGRWLFRPADVDAWIEAGLNRSASSFRGETTRPVRKRRPR